MHTAAEHAGRIPSRFHVTDRLADGRVLRKSNCNVCIPKAASFGLVRGCVESENRLTAPPFS